MAVAASCAFCRSSSVAAANSPRTATAGGAIRVGSLRRYRRGPRGRVAGRNPSAEPASDGVSGGSVGGVPTVGGIGIVRGPSAAPGSVSVATLVVAGGVGCVGAAADGARSTVSVLAAFLMAT